MTQPTDSARLAAAAREGADKRRLANPEDRRSSSVVALFRPREVQAIREAATAAGLTVSNWLRAAALLILRTRTNLAAADLIPDKPLTVAALERETSPVRRGVTPNKAAAPVHCQRLMVTEADMPLILTCEVCGLELLRSHP